MELEHTCSTGEGQTEGRCKEKGHAVLVVVRPVLEQWGVTGVMRRMDSQGTKALRVMANSYEEGVQDLWVVVELNFAVQRRGVQGVEGLGHSEGIG